MAANTHTQKRETVAVETFIGRMVQHTVPKGLKRIRYYGVQATKTFAKVKVAIQVALAKVEDVVKGAVKIIARLTYRQRYAQSTGRDPFRCPHCQHKMELWCIWQRLQRPDKPWPGSQTTESPSSRSFCP